MKEALQRYCVDCKHLNDRFECARPAGDDSIDLVTGIKIRRIPSDAYYERSWQTRPYTLIKYIPDDACGPHARFFEAKE